MIESFILINTQDLIHTSFKIGNLTLPHQLIQGPLAGYSASPMRALFSEFAAPAYAVSEMISAYDVVHKHVPHSRWLHRHSNESLLCYQLAGNDAALIAKAALQLEALGADLIDLNAGCPKPKIRKKGAGSFLLDTPEVLYSIVEQVKKVLTIPFTVKLRIKGDDSDFRIATSLEAAGADALIIHGRRWTDEYDIPSNVEHIRRIKQHVSIPIIANGDIKDLISLHRIMAATACDGFMIARAGCGKPWLYQQLLGHPLQLTTEQHIALFMQHLYSLAFIESEHQAVLQSKSLVRYYFRESTFDVASFYRLTELKSIEAFLYAKQKNILLRL